MKKAMTEYELKFYEAGIRDAGEPDGTIIPCRSKRYINLITELNSQIGDTRGNGAKSYLKGTSFQINHQSKMI